MNAAHVGASTEKRNPKSERPGCPQSIWGFGTLLKGKSAVLWSQQPSASKDPLIRRDLWVFTDTLSYSSATLITKETTHGRQNRRL